MNAQQDHQVQQLQQARGAKAAEGRGAGPAAAASPSVLPLRPPPAPAPEVPPASLMQRFRIHASLLSAELFDDEGLNTVFQHARNILTSTVLIAAGIDASHLPGAQAFTMLWNIHFAGHLVTLAGILLLVLNLWDGLRRLSSRPHALVLRVLAVTAYLVLSLRLTQVILHFRAVM